MKKTKVSLILPALNEEKTIKEVVESLLKFNIVDEVIAVTDGSTDKTPQILTSFGKKIKFFNYQDNHGKGFALAKGVKEAKGEIVVFFDTDQKNIKEKHIRAMVNPLLKDEYDFIIGYVLFVDLGKELSLLKNISGNRAYFRKDILPFLADLEDKRRGVEVFLNHQLHQKRHKLVPLKDLVHILKPGKMPYDQALEDYLKEGFEVAKEYARQKGLIDEVQKIKVQKEQLKKFLKNYMNKFFRQYIKKLKISPKKLKKKIQELLNFP